MNITNTKGLHADAVKILLYGDAGTGKTSLLGTGDNQSTLILSAESGLLSLNEKDIAVASISNWREFQQAYAEISKDPELQKFTTIGIDSLTEIADMLVTHLEKQPEFQDPKNTFKLWGEYNKRMTSVIKAFRDLPNVNVIFTALVEDVKDGQALIKKPLIAGSKAQQMLPSYFDEVFYLNVNSATQERELHTQPTLSFVAKDRSGKLDSIEQPNLLNLISKIKGEGNERNTLRAS